MQDYIELEIYTIIINTMKKLFGLLALVLAVVSCQNDFDGTNLRGDEVAVTLNVAVPDDATRAAGSDSALSGLQNIDLNRYDIRYILEVYDKDGELAKGPIVKCEDVDASTSFDLRLVPGRAYRFVVWADFVLQDSDDDLHYYTEGGLQNISLLGDQKANDESRDAYTCVHLVERFQSGAPIAIELKRPFAKLRVVTTDMNHLYSPLTSVTVDYTTPIYTTYNALTEVKGGLQDVATKVVDFTKKVTETEEDYVYVYTEQEYKDAGKMTLFADYFFGTVDDAIHFTLDAADATGMDIPEVVFNTNIPVQRNYLTTVMGPVLTDAANVTVEIKDAFDGYINHEDEEVSITVDTAEDFIEAIESEDIDTIVLTEDITLGAVQTRAAYTAITIAAGKELTIDLNGKSITGTTAENSGNQELFLVKGELTIKNGTITTEHVGENMLWNSMTTIFDVTAGGVLNLEGVTAKNLGGSDMGFVAHLNNWGEVTLNVENCTLESNYVPVRVFNSGPNMNNVTIKNSTLTGNSAAFWVHNYTVADFGTEAKAEAQKALLNLNIYNQGNTFTPDVNGIRYGFTNSIRTDAYGITKVVSEDGTVVTLGSFVENGVIRRGVAGAEENTTIKKVIVEEGVAVLYDRTFRRFYALEEVVLPSTLTTIGAAGSGVFQSCNNLKTIVIPESVTVLGKGSFQECTSLESINIPAGVTRIESDALRNTGLKSVEFHAGVTYFGAQAFRDCKQLTEVVINAPEFTMENNTFGIMAAPFTPMTIRVANPEMKVYVESMLTAHAKTYITVVAPEVVTTVEDLNAAIKNNCAVIIGADIENANIKLPAELSNFTLRAAEGVSLQNTTIFAADGNAYHYENLTFDGITFDNSRIVLTGWRTGEVLIKNLVVTNCVFENIEDTTNNAAVHINMDAAEAVENFTFTNNVINGATGGSKSGVYAQVTGKVVFENNVINNVSFRPYVIQITTDDGIADTFTVCGNTFSGSSVGRAQSLGNNAEGADSVKLVVSGNIFKDITESQQICYWNFNPVTTTADLSKNYYSIDIEANPSRIYYNAAAASVEDLKAMGVFPYYTALNADGTINLNSLKQAE